MNYNIRKVTLEDIPIIWKMGKDVPFFETAEDIITFWPESVLNDCVDKEDVLFLVMEVENKILGFIIGNINNSLKKCEVENIFIVPEYRKQGYARILLKDLIQQLRTRGIENICAMSEGSVVDFYKKNNFTKGNQFYWMDLALSDRFKKEVNK